MNYKFQQTFRQPRTIQSNYTDRMITNPSLICSIWYFLKTFTFDGCTCLTYVVNIKIPLNSCLLSVRRLNPGMLSGNCFFFTLNMIRAVLKSLNLGALSSMEGRFDEYWLCELYMCSPTQQMMYASVREQ